MNYNFIICAVKSFSHITTVLYTKIPQMKKERLPLRKPNGFDVTKLAGEGKAHLEK